MNGRQDRSRDYVLKPVGSLKATLKAKKVLGLGVNDHRRDHRRRRRPDLLHTGRVLHASCPIDHGRNTTVGWNTAVRRRWSAGRSRPGM